MEDWFTKYKKAFGDESLPPISLYELEPRLRFELGGEVWGADRPIRRFLQAHNRACTVTEFIFQNSDQIHVMILSFGDENGINTGFSRLLPILPDLTRENFDFKGPIECINNPEGHEYWHVFPVTDPIQIRELLWLDIARDLGIKPVAEHHAYFVDFDQSILVNAYDDRGMDVMAIDADKLKPAYTRFDDWLLDYDRLRMASLFGTP